ncbi:MAG: class I SAM-dependent rRNA methyltransferase, partial [Chloroflexi bacterium]
MSLLKLPQNKPITLRLARNLTRNIKRGHPWVFADALRDCPPAPPGTHAILLDNKKGAPIARGFYSGTGPLAFRVCTTQPDQPLSNEWAERRMTRALGLRQMLFGSETTGYRLFNGEGDGLPGLVCDVYGDSAVIQLDGTAPTAFWNATAIGRWVAHQLNLRRVYQKAQSRKVGGSRALVGSVPAAPVPFLENGVHFTVDLVHGQKTGFFLDQRDNRQQIGRIAAGLDTLNVFGYTGGFSVMAGLGGAPHVTTVDLAGPALRAADHHWQLNHLPAERHQSIKADA